MAESIAFSPAAAEEENQQNSPGKSLLNFVAHVLEFCGLVTLYRSSIDAKILISMRYLRFVAFGASTLILVSYLSALGISESYAGIFMSLTVFGDIFISFVITLFADRLGRRNVIAVGSLLMSISGIVFALTDNYWALLIAAVIGVISPNGNEIGPFRAIEESTMADLVSPESRADMFAWYALIGSAGSATGLMICGWVISALVTSGSKSYAEAYQVIFYAYAGIGIIKCLLACCMSLRCEAEKPPKVDTDQETTALLAQADTQRPSPSKDSSPKALFNPEYRGILLQLCLWLGLDALASGLAPLTWVTYFFKIKFNLQEGAMGSIFFASSIIAAASVLVAASLAKRFGNIKTMVFTHLPSAVFLAMIPLPSSFPLAATFVLLRACTQSMDVAPRSAFLAAILPAKQRTAMMGTINMVKTVSLMVGPVVTGFLARNNLFWVAFISAGALKATYDLGMLATFLHFEPRT